MIFFNVYTFSAFGEVTSLRELSQSCESLLKYKISGTTPLRQACLAQSFSHVQLFVTLWTVALQAPLPMGFPRQEHWSGLPFPTPGDLPTQGLSRCFCIGRWILYHWSQRGSFPPPTYRIRIVQPPRALQLISMPGSLAGKESACNVGDPGSIPWSGRSTAEGIGYPL